MSRTALSLLPLLFVGQAGAQVPPVRFATTPVAVSRERLGAGIAIRELASGRVVVSDSGRRRLFTLDPALSDPRIILDAALAGDRAFPNAETVVLMAARGDSTFLFDSRSVSISVFDGEGHSVRVMSLPQPRDVTFIDAQYGLPGIDPDGRLVYRVQRLGPGVGVQDSGTVVRADFVRRAIDSVGRIAISPFARASIVANGDGTRTMTSTRPAFTIGDDWALTSTGDVAFLRPRDYHVDWVAADGTRRSSPPIAWPWRRLTDDDKQRIADSLAASLQHADSAINATRRRTNSTGPMMRTLPQPVAEMPDYAPPFDLRTARGDLDGNVWVRERERAAGGASVYDVIDHAGRLVMRVQFAPGRIVVGFGRGHSAYLISGLPGSVVLERVVID